MRILGPSGSLRRDSHNTRLLRAAAMSLPSGVELELFDGLGDLPHYNVDIAEDSAPAWGHGCSSSGAAEPRLRGTAASADSAHDSARPLPVGRIPAAHYDRPVELVVDLDRRLQTRGGHQGSGPSAGTSTRSTTSRQAIAAMIQMTIRITRYGGSGMPARLMM